MGLFCAYSIDRMHRFELLVLSLGLAVFHYAPVAQAETESVESSENEWKMWPKIVAGIDYSRAHVEKNCPTNSEGKKSSLRTEDMLRSYPELSSPTDCARTCLEGEHPRICYYHFVLEYYTTLTSACDLCAVNYTNAFCNNCQCVTADGVERSILTVNRMIPGPSIEVCQGDTVMVDVENKMEGEAASIHWHGILQRGTQYYDGAAFVTQCPITEGSSFRYEWIAREAGTHFWHAHTGVQKMDGIFGSIVIRQPEDRDPNAHLYEYDLSEHVVVISDWFHELSMSRLPGRMNFEPGQDADAALINGKGRYQDPVYGNSTDTPLAVFDVERHKRYRFRMVNAFCTVCAGVLSVEGHRLTVIAVDGAPIEHVVVDSIASLSGERFDFVINAEKWAGSYWIQLRLTGPCTSSSIQQLAILRYKSRHRTTLTVPPTFEKPIPEGVLLNALDGMCDEPRRTKICISELKSALPVEEDLLTKEPDMTAILPLSFYRFPKEELFKPNTYKRFLITRGRFNSISRIKGISFQFPSSPLLTEASHLLPGSVCNETSKPADCGEACYCTHVIDLPYKGIAEFIIFDDGNVPTLTHPLHLHGYSYKVLKMGKLNTSYTGEEKVEYVQDLHNKGRLWASKNKLPPSKDSLGIPAGGYAVVRFRADNPGYWLFHCHFIYHMETGMALIFRVGRPSDLPPIPKGFPKCGNYLPKMNHQWRRQTGN